MKLYSLILVVNKALQIYAIYDYLTMHYHHVTTHQNFPCDFALLLKRKHQHVGHIQITLWVSGSTGVTHFQPWLQPYSSGATAN